MIKLTEKEARELYDNGTNPEHDDHEFHKDLFINNLKKKGYIKKTALEYARIYANLLQHDKNADISQGELGMLLERYEKAIEELKNES